MTQFILIRHGQSTANTQGYFAGQTDSPLTELGRQQAELTADYIIANYKVDAVYASDLSRAYETGKTVADRLKLPVITDKALREIYSGLWQGVSFTQLVERFSDSYGVWLHDIGNAVCPEGESVKQLQRRVVDALRRIGQENEGKSLVIATHATPIRALMCHCQGKSADEMKDVPWVSNASVTLARWDGEALSIVEADICRHLGEMVSRFGKNV